MVPVLISLALVANSYQPARASFPRYEQVATASVTIINSEEIHFDADARNSKGRARQQRVRAGVPLIEFY